MQHRIVCLGAALALLAGGCVTRESSPGASSSDSAPATVVATSPAPADSVPGKPLTDFACELAVRGVPGTMKAGENPTEVKVRVTNHSKAGENWPAMLPGRAAPFVVNLAYTWKLGETVTEGHRGTLPEDLKPGQGADLGLNVTPPTTPGAYTLRIEPVQESVAWFGNAGGCHADFKVTITP